MYSIAAIALNSSLHHPLSGVNHNNTMYNSASIQTCHSFSGDDFPYNILNIFIEMLPTIQLVSFISL